MWLNNLSICIQINTSMFGEMILAYICIEINSFICDEILNVKWESGLFAFGHFNPGFFFRPYLIPIDSHSQWFLMIPIQSICNQYFCSLRYQTRSFCSRLFQFLSFSTHFMIYFMKTIFFKTRERLSYVHGSDGSNIRNRDATASFFFCQPQPRCGCEY